MTPRLKGRGGHTWERPYVSINNNWALSHTCTHRVFAINILHKFEDSGMEALSLLHQNLYYVIRSQKVPISSRRTRCVIHYAGACSSSDSSAGAFMFARMLWVTYVKLASESLLMPAGSIMAHGSLWPFKQQSQRAAPHAPWVRPKATPCKARWRPHKQNSWLTLCHLWCHITGRSTTLNHFCFPADCRISASSSQTHVAGRTWLHAQLFQLLFGATCHECWANA